MACSTAQDAEAIYIEYRKHGENGWGPFIHCDDVKRQQFLHEEIGRVLCGSAKLSRDRRTVRFPSAWHAALYLIRTQDFLILNAPHIHQCYRGQANPQWQIESTFDRLTPERKDKEWSASTLFSSYIHRRLNCPEIHMASYAAIARHMGFATGHLDCSVDPAVAVYFASQEEQSSKDGKVYSFKIPSVVQNGLEVWCAPPFCDRIYSQLGVFLKPASEAKPDLYSKCPAVQFPKPDSSHPFQVWRDGKEVDLMHTNQWLLDAVEWARRESRSNPDIIHSTDLLIDTVEQGVADNPPAPSELLLNDPVQKSNWGFRVLDLYHWIFVFVKADNCGRGFDMNVSRSVIRHNRAITELVIGLMETVISVRPEYEMHGLEKNLRSVLESLEEPDEHESAFYGKLPA
jgi:hypothetical protein